MALRVASARKTNYRALQTNSVPAKDLSETCLIRTTGSERKQGQYKFVDDTGKITYFNSFKEFRYFSNRCLFSKHKHVIIKRGNQ